MTLSLPIKVAALAAVALLLGAAGVATFFLGHRSQTPARVATPPARPTTTPAVQHHVAPPKPRVLLAPGLPAPLHTALMRSREVVAFVYSPRSADDVALLAQVRKGARQAKVGFVALDVRNAALASALYTWTGGASDPATYVVRRPGNTVFTIPGLTDSTAVAQAAGNAK
jgi:hypothetical protein